LSQWFDPEPFFKGLPFAKALKEKGHEVQVLTGFPNYPGGKVYPGYRIKLFQRENMDGIPVTRVALYPSHDRSSIKRILNYLSFAIFAAIFGPILVGDVDLIYAYHPPATIGLPALILKYLKKAPIVYDIQDLWPDAVRVSGMLNSKIAISLLDLWCKLIYRFSDKIVVLSPGFKEALKSRGVPAEKIEVIYNWCDENSLLFGTKTIDFKDELIFKGKFNIIFAGNIGKGQGLEAIIDAAELLKGECLNIQFIFVGDGVELESLRSKAEKKKLSNVIFLSRRPITQIGELLCRADVLLVHLKDIPLFKITIPSKIQAYMSIGKPIMVGAKGDAEKLVKEAKAGISCIPGDPRSIAECAKIFYEMESETLKNMGNNGKHFYENNLSIKVGVEKFSNLFYEIDKQKSRANKNKKALIRIPGKMRNEHGKRIVKP